MRLFFSLIALISVFVLSACSVGKQGLALNGTDITGADFAQSFVLTDHTGKTRELNDFKGKVVVLFFGYTHCPDVCPTTMQDMANAMKLLGDDSKDVQILFVTLDPERDTKEVLAQFVPSFDKRFIGLYGTPAQTDETAKNFKIFYSRQPSKSVKAIEHEKSATAQERYTIDHSAGSYVFDKEGKIRIYLKYGQKPAEIAGDLKQLL